MKTTHKLHINLYTSAIVIILIIHYSSLNNEKISIIYHIIGNFKIMHTFYTQTQREKNKNYHLF